MHLLPFKVREFLFIKHLDAYFDRIGVWFQYYGDEVCWMWPWKRKGRGKYISLGFTGTGEWGDACFHSLKELRTQWDEFFKALNSLSEVVEDPNLGF